MAVLKTEFLLRAPVQERSRQSLLRIYAATNRLLADTHFDQITVAQIARESRVAVGSIYQRFGSKDALLWAIYDRYIQEAVERVDTLAPSADEVDLSRRISAIIELVCGLFANHRGIVRSLLLRYRQSPEQISGRYQNKIGHVDAAIRNFLSGTGPSKVPEQKVAFGHMLIMAACREHILFSSTPQEDQATDANSAFRDRLTQAVAASMIWTRDDET